MYSTESRYVVVDLKFKSNNFIMIVFCCDVFVSIIMLMLFRGETSLRPLGNLLEENCKFQRSSKLERSEAIQML